MPSIYIPREVQNVFKVIYELTDEKLDKLIESLNKSQITTNFKAILESIDVLDDQSQLNDLFSTLISFSELLQDSEESYESLSNRLSDSYFEIFEELKNENKQSLKANLQKIFDNCDNFLISIKSKGLQNENNCVFSECKILTDIRIIFNKDINLSNRNALIIHNLHIQFYKDNNLKELFLSLNLSDLKLFKKSIERAIAKEELIVNDYKNINFIS